MATETIEERPPQCARCNDGKCDYCDDDDVLIDEPIHSKPIARYKSELSIEGCTCGKGVIMQRWVKQEGDVDDQ